MVFSYTSQILSISLYLTSIIVIRINLQVGVTWRRSTRLPIKINNVRIAIINSKVYCGGGITDDSCRDDEHIVYCYDPLQDKWTTLPPLSVYYFGLGQVNGKLVVVGGRMTNSDEYSRVVWILHLRFCGLNCINVKKIQRIDTDSLEPRCEGLI